MWCVGQQNALCGVYPDAVQCLENFDFYMTHKSIVLYVTMILLHGLSCIDLTNGFDVSLLFIWFFPVYYVKILNISP